MLPISFLTTSLALAATSVSALSLPLLPRQQSNNTTSSEFGWPTAVEALVRPNYFDGVVTMETLAGQQKFGAVDYCREVNLTAGDWVQPGQPLNVSIVLVPCPVNNGTVSCFRSTTLATNADPRSTLTWFNDIYTNVGFAFIFEQQNGRTLAQLVTTVPPRVNPGQCDQSRLGRPLRAESLTGTIQGKLEPAAGSAGYASYRVPKALVVLTVGITAVLWS